MENVYTRAVNIRQRILVRPAAWCGRQETLLFISAERDNNGVADRLVYKQILRAHDRGGTMAGGKPKPTLMDTAFRVVFGPYGPLARRPCLSLIEAGSLPALSTRFL